MEKDDIIEYKIQNGMMDAEVKNWLRKKQDRWRFVSPESRRIGRHYACKKPMTGRQQQARKKAKASRKARKRGK